MLDVRFEAIIAVCIFLAKAVKVHCRATGSVELPRKHVTKLASVFRFPFLSQCSYITQLINVKLV